MSCSEKDSDILMLSKEELDSSSTDEGCCSGSSTGGGMINLKKGPWTAVEDSVLISYVHKNGEGNWNAVQKQSGLLRCGKSCRLRWSNHLRPNLKKEAFSPEEEQLIFQMHSKMGNKWSRMAARLPGRTDNGIKNYWNTLVKRRLRAGLPLHAYKVNLQTSNENQLIQSASEFCRGQGASDFCSGKQQNTGVSTGTMNGMPEFRFLPYKANPGLLTYRSPFPDNYVTGMPIHGLGNNPSRFLNPEGDHVKQTWEFGSSFEGCNVSLTSMVPAFEELPNMNSATMYSNPGLGLPDEPDTESKSRTPFICSTPGNQSSSNDNFSSSTLLPGAVKMELPSLQRTEAAYIDWNTSLFASSYAVDTCIQTPEIISAQSGCASPRNKGLLEELVQESQAISTRKKQSFKKSPDDAHTVTNKSECSTVKFEEIRDPTSPFCLSAVSLFNECSEATMFSVKQDQHAPNFPDFLRPDVLLGSGWLTGNSQSSVDSIFETLEEDLRDQRVAVSDGISSMASLESYPWTKNASSLPYV